MKFNVIRKAHHPHAARSEWCQLQQKAFIVIRRAASGKCAAFVVVVALVVARAGSGGGKCPALMVAPVVARIGSDCGRLWLVSDGSGGASPP